LETCYRLGISAVTVYAFSIENFKRSKEEVAALMRLQQEFLTSISAPNGVCERYNVAVRIVGRTDLLEPDFLRTIEKVCSPRKDAQKILNFCLAYTSRDEITSTIRKLVAEQVAGSENGVASGSRHITVAAISDALLTAGSPPLDILVRTSGVRRLSDFMLWQCHNSTMFEVVDTYWPDFGIRDLFPIILKWQEDCKRRTAGQVNGQPGQNCCNE
jgi:ditrans,polycis-polyprenyl diphosphate synthase